MNKCRWTVFTFLTMCLVLCVLGTFAQDTTRWEKGKCVMESRFESSAKPGDTLDMVLNAMDAKVIGDAGDKLTLEEKLVFDVNDTEEAKRYYEKYHVVLESVDRGFRYRAPDGNRRFKGGSLILHVPESYNIDITTNGGDLNVRKVRGLVDLTTSGGDVDVATISGDVEISSSGGDISLNDVEGNINAATSGGDIDVTRCKPRIDVKTSGGDLEFHHVSGSVKAVTSGGDIVMRDLDGEAELSTSGGDIEIYEVKGNKSVKSATSGGDIYVKDAEANVSAATSSGDIEMENVRGSVEMASSNGEIDGTNIEGSSIRAASSNGNITLENVSGALVASTSLGDVSIKVIEFKESFAIELSTSDGSITCTLPVKYKGTIRAKIDNWRKHDSEDINSDFPLNVRTEDSRTRVATGDINGGGPEIRLETSRGDIIIEKY